MNYYYDTIMKTTKSQSLEAQTIRIFVSDISLPSPDLLALKTRPNEFVQGAGTALGIVVTRGSPSPCQSVFGLLIKRDPLALVN